MHFHMWFACGTKNKEDLNRFWEIRFVSKNFGLRSSNEIGPNVNCPSLLMQSNNPDEYRDLAEVCLDLKSKKRYNSKTIPKQYFLPFH